MKMPNISKNVLLYRFEQLLILLAHLLLLKWILYTLSEGGSLDTVIMLLHFTGMGLYGAVLIRLCAYLAKRRYEKEHA